MMRTLTGLMMALTLGLASAATAATMSVETDAKTYFPGDTITVTSTLTTSGGEASASSTLLELLWNDASISGTPGPASYPSTLVSGGFFAWVPGTGICLSASCLVLDQLSPVITGAVPDAGTITMTLTMVADSSVGLINFGTGVEILFGATASFGPNITTASVVPEPGAASLLGLGLGVVAVAGRRRR